MDTRLFDSINIRLLSEQVGEKDLYDFCYDYDSSYEHALWGAIRESSYLKCVNPTHIYHIVPDIDNLQKLKSVNSDIIIVMQKILNVLSEVFQEPNFEPDK